LADVLKKTILEVASADTIDRIGTITARRNGDGAKSALQSVVKMVDEKGIEPSASALRTRRSPS
jgi:hypothetical protein